MVLHRLIPIDLNERSERWPVSTSMILKNGSHIIDQWLVKLRKSGRFMWLSSKIFQLVEKLGPVVAFRKEKE